MLKIKQEKIEEYLKSNFGQKTKLKKVTFLGSGFHGSSYRLEIISEGEKKNLVLKTISDKEFGHEYPADRAQVLILSNQSFNELPKHTRSLDVVGINKKQELVSLSDCTEFAIVMNEVTGTCHMDNFKRIKETKQLKKEDLNKEVRLAEYLGRIHQVKKDSPSLYKRKLRDIIGHGECLMGVIDTYPKKTEFATRQELTKIVQATIPYWNNLKFNHERLCQIHGDFYPGNIYFHNGDFTLLDRSRGVWGEAADDVSAYTINYITYALWSEKEWKGVFKKLFNQFFETYLEKTGDKNIMNYLPLFYAFRGIVVIHPLFYPNIPTRVRERVLNFVKNILKENRFEPEKVKDYLTV